MWKLIDRFNGWEGDERYAEREDADTALDAAVAAFHNHLANTGLSCRTAVVRSDAEWHHDGQRWVWG